jgi:hypothetical protein
MSAEVMAVAGSSSCAAKGRTRRHLASTSGAPGAVCRGVQMPPASRDGGLRGRGWRRCAVQLACRRARRAAGTEQGPLRRLRGSTDPGPPEKGRAGDRAEGEQYTAARKAGLPAYLTLQHAADRVQRRADSSRLRILANDPALGALPPRRDSNWCAMPDLTVVPRSETSASSKSYSVPQRLQRTSIYRVPGGDRAANLSSMAGPKPASAT